MNSSPASEGKGDWFLTSEVNDFTDEDKTEALTTLNMMARGLLNLNRELAYEYDFLSRQLQNMPAEKAQACLMAYLEPDNLTKITNIKSFLYLKKLAEDLLEENKLLEKKLAEKVVLSLLHIVFYKTMPCALGNHCKHYPRKIVHKNDFLDTELDCYFYHHEKDRRRFVLNDSEKEFRYAGNFADNKKGGGGDKSGFSQNFFESLFHPLYYKNFKCVRTKCEKSIYCPYFHSEEEKTVWGVFFKGFFGKDREVFTKKRSGEEDNYQRIRFKKLAGLDSGLGSRIAFNGPAMIK